MTAPTPALPSFTNGTVPTAADLGALASNVSNLYTFGQGGFRTLRPMVLLRITRDDRTIATNSNLIMQWDTQDADTDDMWSGIVSEVITINTAGVYRIGFQLALKANPSARSLVAGRILLNGTDAQLNAISASFAPYEAATPTAVFSSVLLPLAVNDQIRFHAVQQCGATAALDPTFGSCRAFLFWVSP